jgi:RNA polymerase sigma-70 factor (ECF subfamily)
MTNNEEDFETIKSVRAGDIQAYGVLVGKYQGLLFNLALRMTGSVEEAEDTAQSSFIMIYEKLDSFDPGRSFRNWAYTIALNKIRNTLRRKKLVSFLSLDAFKNPDGRPVQIADSAQNTEEKAIGNELLAGIERDLLKLPPDTREAFILFHFHNNSVSDIAALTGATENAVSIRLHRARAFLASNLSRNSTRKDAALVEGRGKQ